MYESGTFYNKPCKKSARIVGDVIGKDHPRGDQAAYDTLVRMAQDFSLRYIVRLKSELFSAQISTGKNTIVIGTKLGRALQFKESDVRPMGRSASGVGIINLEAKDRVCSIAKVRESRTARASLLGRAAAGRPPPAR